MTRNQFTAFLFVWNVAGFVLLLALFVIAFGWAESFGADNSVLRIGAVVVVVSGVWAVSLRWGNPFSPTKLPSEKARQRRTVRFQALVWIVVFAVSLWTALTYDPAG
jgi:uncharacterized membrane protein YozB (DUF420 family)